MLVKASATTEIARVEVAGADEGIRVANSSGTLIESLVALGNGLGIAVAEGTKTTIANATLVNNRRS